MFHLSNISTESEDGDQSGSAATDQFSDKGPPPPTSQQINEWNLKKCLHWVKVDSKAISIFVDILRRGDVSK